MSTKKKTPDPDENIRVLHAILNLETGGAQEVVRTLVKYQKLYGCRPVVCTLKDGPVKSRIEKLGVKVVVIRGRKWGIHAFPLFLADMIRIHRDLRKVVNDYDIDVIQTHLFRILDFLVLLLPFTTSLRAVAWTFHSVNFSLRREEMTGMRWLLGPKRMVQHLIYRRTSPYVGKYIAVSDEVKRNMEKVIGEIGNKITVISNGVDVETFESAGDGFRMEVRRELSLPDRAQLVINVANLLEAKGLNHLVDAAAVVVSSNPDVHFLLAGEGRLREELEEQVRRNTLETNIHFLGVRGDIPRLLAASDLFVLSSIWEGLSMALLEAMAAARPIVATAVSGSEQALTPDKTGLIVPAGDSAALAGAINRLLRDRTFASSLGNAAKEHVFNNFSARKQAEEHSILYRELLGVGPAEKNNSSHRYRKQDNTAGH